MTSTLVGRGLLLLSSTAGLLLALTRVNEGAETPTRPLRMRAGAAKAQGKREYQEDEVLVSGWKSPDGETTRVFGVFDGHGGARCSAVARANAVDALRSTHAQYGERTESWIRESLRELERRYVTATANRVNVYEGATACIAVTISNDQSRLAVGNIGDSRCAICGVKSGLDAALSEDHKPQLPAERARIANLGGQVARRSGSNTWRVYDASGRGGLAMSRALGDTFYGEAVPAEADVRVIQLDPRYHSALLLATDGLWDVMDISTACNLVREGILKNQSPNGIASSVVQRAINLDTSDNTSAVVVLIDKGEKKAAKKETTPTPAKSEL